MAQLKRAMKRRRSLTYNDVVGPCDIFWFADCPEGHFRMPPVPRSERPGAPCRSGTKYGSMLRNTLVRYGPDRVATPSAPEDRHHEEHEMKQGNDPAYGARVTILGASSGISGGALI